MKNPVELVPPGERGEIMLASDVRASVVRGRLPGPIVWAWAARGEADPSMAQALGELRDRLRPSELEGALGLLILGPPPPIGREQYPWAAPIRAICDGAHAVVLLESMLPGYQAAAHVAVDLDDKAARAVASGLRAEYVAPHLVTPPPNRAIVTAPSVQWLDGESERLERAVIDRAQRAIRSLLAALGMLDEAPAHARVRVVLKAMAEVDAQGPGLVEPVVRPGSLVRAGEPVAFVGEPGLRARRPLRAPATGVVLWTRAGQLTGGVVAGIGKLRRALPSVLDAEGSERAATVEVGWCERVALPELGVDGLQAKIDTGARSSALHVASLRELGRTPEGRARLEIEVPTGTRGRFQRVEVEVREHAQVRDSGGHAERRPVIETLLRLGTSERRVRVTLTSRGDMLFPMLVGRTALGDEVRVHPSRRFLLGR